MNSNKAASRYDEIERVVKSELSVTEGFQHIIQFCERLRPHSDWALFRALDVEADLRHLEQWLSGILRTTPLPAAVTGFWFGLFNPVVEDHEVSADMHVIGAPYDANDDQWLFRHEWWGMGTPKARSSVLHAIYRKAYREGGEGLKNDAEYPLALAYGTLAIRHVARQVRAELLQGVKERVLYVGFNSGDFICIGAVRAEGLVFSRDCTHMR